MKMAQQFQAYNSAGDVHSGWFSQVLGSPILTLSYDSVINVLVNLVRLEELASWGQQVMDNLGWGEGDSRRVTWAPNARLLRYYTTLGLLDRAARFEGRTAFYGSKHLLQILAIKYLQLAGKKLEEIQSILLGLGEDGLAKLVGLHLPLTPPTATGQVPLPKAEPRRSDFWAEVPQANDQPTELQREHSPGRSLQCLEPIPGLQILVDAQQLPSHFDLAKLLDWIEQSQREGEP